MGQGAGTARLLNRANKSSALGQGKKGLFGVTHGGLPLLTEEQCGGKYQDNGCPGRHRRDVSHYFMTGKLSLSPLTAVV